MSAQVHVEWAEASGFPDGSGVGVHCGSQRFAGAGLFLVTWVSGVP